MEDFHINEHFTNGVSKIVVGYQYKHKLFILSFEVGWMVQIIFTLLCVIHKHRFVLNYIYIIHILQVKHMHKKTTDKGLPTGNNRLSI